MQPISELRSRPLEPAQSQSHFLPSTVPSGPAESATPSLVAPYYSWFPSASLVYYHFFYLEGSRSSPPNWLLQTLHCGSLSPAPLTLCPHKYLHIKVIKRCLVQSHRILPHGCWDVYSYVSADCIRTAAWCTCQSSVVQSMPLTRRGVDHGDLAPTGSQTLAPHCCLVPAAIHPNS